MDLKDKWRNVMRTALSPVLYKKREATEIPENMLEDIRSLATAKEKETLATNNAMEAKLTNTTHTAIMSPSTSGDGNDSNSNEDGEDDAFVTDNNAESSQQKNTALVERNTVTVSKSDVKQQQHAPIRPGTTWSIETSLPVDLGRIASVS